MKKILLLMASFISLIMSCSDGVDEPVLPAGSPDPLESGVPVSMQELKETVWFYGNAEICFPYENETLFINYMPDTLNTEKWISLKENANGTFTAKVEWSNNVREIGKTSKTTITKLNNKISVNCDFFKFSNMTSYEGIPASRFDPDKVPPLKAEYLSNFSGKYTLDTSHYELYVGAKLGISQSAIRYWNANVLNSIVREDGAYDLLLAHSSSNNGSGSIDPGITGCEPFISRQGLFWSHLVLSQAPGSKWNISWSSTWYESPYEALNAEMDMTDTFTGPATTKLTYKYNFYYGIPKLVDGWYKTERGEKIGTYSEQLDLPTTKTWKQILEAANINPTIPEGKLKDYWWYSNNGFYSQVDSYAVKLSDSSTPGLTEYDFFLALKDKPADSGIYYLEGHFKNTTGEYDLTVTPGGITYNGTDYVFVAGSVWSNFSEANGGEPQQVAYIVSSNGKNYFCMIEYQINNKSRSDNYVNFREPKETEESSDASKGDRTYTIFGTRRSTLNKQQ